MSRSAFRASSTASASRPARHFLIASTAASSTAGSTVMMPPSPPPTSGFGSDSVNLFRPTMMSSPDSIRRRRSASEVTSADLR